MQITIPFKTPTINHLYWHRGNIKIITKEARKLKADIKDIISKIPFPQYPEVPLKVSVDIYENWFCKNGDIKKKDIANREKFLIDSIFEAIGMDDKLIFENSFRKINSETEEKAIITIEVLNG